MGYHQILGSTCTNLTLQLAQFYFFWGGPNGFKFLDYLHQGFRAFHIGLKILEAWPLPKSGATVGLQFWNDGMLPWISMDVNTSVAGGWLWFFPLTVPEVFSGQGTSMTLRSTTNFSSAGSSLVSSRPFFESMVLALTQKSGILAWRP